jgi:hypothetical protein
MLLSSLVKQECEKCSAKHEIWSTAWWMSVWLNRKSSWEEAEFFFPEVFNDWFCTLWLYQQTHLNTITKVHQFHVEFFAERTFVARIVTWDNSWRITSRLPGTHNSSSANVIQSWSFKYIRPLSACLHDSLWLHPHHHQDVKSSETQINVWQVIWTSYAKGQWR